MKILLTITLIFIVTTIHRPIEYVKIEHIGIGDKPIPTIIISKDSINLPKKNFSTIYYGRVDQNDFDDIKSSVNHVKSDKFKVAEFGTFEISVVDGGKD